jgi:hypothetical protein
MQENLHFPIGRYRRGQLRPGIAYFLRVIADSRIFAERANTTSQGKKFRR